MTATSTRTCEYGPHPVAARWYVLDPSGFRVATCDEHLVASLALWGMNAVSHIGPPGPSRPGSAIGSPSTFPTPPSCRTCRRPMTPSVRDGDRVWTCSHGVDHGRSGP